jgi:hypothetical protein
LIDDRERTQVAGVFTNNNDGYRQMREVARRFPRWVWAVEGAGGVGRQLAQRPVADGKIVVDVPPKLSTRCARCRLTTAAKPIPPTPERSRSSGSATRT